MPGNGNHRSETVAEYLKEAERCEQFASHSKDADRQIGSIWQSGFGS